MYDRSKSVGITPFPNSIRRNLNSSSSARRYQQGLQQIKYQQNCIPNLNIPSSPIQNRQKKQYQHLNEFQQAASNASVIFNYDKMHKDRNSNMDSTAYYNSARYRVHHINLVHEYIAKTRQKKSQIQDLLRAQQVKAQSQQLNQVEVGNSLRRLKKVLRLLEITSKLILGKSENSQLHASLQNHMTLSSNNSQILDNYEFELKQKNNQIKRLKRLVQLLSAPEKPRFQNDMSETLILRNSMLEQSLLTKMYEQCSTQTQQIQYVTSQIPSRIIEQSADYSIQKRPMEITHAYSLWSITQNKCNKQSSKSQNGTNTTKPCLSYYHNIMQLYLSPTLQTSIFQPVNNTSAQFMRRYKSLVKLCLYSLNLCIGVAARQYPVMHGLPPIITSITVDPSCLSSLKMVSSRVQQFAGTFNSKYYHNGQHDYDQKFCDYCKKQLEQTYHCLKSALNM